MEVTAPKVGITLSPFEARFFRHQQLMTSFLDRTKTGQSRKLQALTLDIQTATNWSVLTLSPGKKVVLLRHGLVLHLRTRPQRDCLLADPRSATSSRGSAWVVARVMRASQLSSCSLHIPTPPFSSRGHLLFRKTRYKAVGHQSAPLCNCLRPRSLDAYSFCSTVQARPCFVQALPPCYKCKGRG